MFFYFLTVDKCKTQDEIYPTIGIYRKVLKDINIMCGAKLTDLKYPVECFEFKEKIVKKIKTKKWLHYHGIYKTKLKIIYKRVKVKNFSVSWRPLTNMQDMATYSGYCNKDKIDKSRFITITK